MMKRVTTIVAATAIAISSVFLATTASAQMRHGGHPAMHHGMGQGGAGGGPMMGPVAMLTKQDADSAADMRLVHQLLMSHSKIKRTVTNLSDGIRTTTESDDPYAAQAIKQHVASMSQRLQDGREFNIFSDTLPVLFENADKIRSTVEMTEKGAVVTRTSADPKVVAALQGHAAEVTELVTEGMLAMRRGMMTRMAMGRGRPGSGAPGGGLPHEPHGER
jgi:Spy/CpxP family protein refolding chaperone